MVQRQVLQKSDRKRIDAFEIWCWQMVTNGIQLLEAQVVKVQLSYYGHTQRAGGMENVMMTGQMEGRRRHGRPRKRWLQGIWEFMAGHQLKTEDMTNRRIWCTEINRVTRGQMWLDGTKWQSDTTRIVYLIDALE